MNREILKLTDAGRQATHHKDISNNQHNMERPPKDNTETTPQNIKQKK